MKTTFFYKGGREKSRHTRISNHKTLIVFRIKCLELKPLHVWPCLFSHFSCFYLPRITFVLLLFERRVSHVRTVLICPDVLARSVVVLRGFGLNINVADSL